MKMTTKAPNLCPHCGAKDQHDRKHKVYYHNGHPRCSVHGCTFSAGEWEFVCAKCHDRHLDKLYGYMVPHLCKECFDATIAEQERAQNVCNICGKARVACPH